MTDLVEKVVRAFAAELFSQDSASAIEPSQIELHGDELVIDYIDQGWIKGAAVGKAILSAIEAAGYVIVPRVPSEAMMKAGASAGRWQDILLTEMSTKYPIYAAEVYTAMIEASQKG